MDTGAAINSPPWYRSLNSEQWRVLIASNLGWLFDGFEIYALFLTIGFALHQLLEAAQYAEIPRYAGYVLATTVFGWATGGVIGGIIADYIGRKRTMMLAILAYSLTTALSAAAWNWQSFAVLRFLVLRGAGIGSLLASGVWLLIGGLGPGAALQQPAAFAARVVRPQFGDDRRAGRPFGADTDADQKAQNRERNPIPGKGA